MSSIHTKLINQSTIFTFKAAFFMNALESLLEHVGRVKTYIDATGKLGNIPAFFI